MIFAPYLRKREAKPRLENGLTSVIDTGLSYRELEDLIETSGEFVDFIKFGWGTAVLSTNLQRKIDLLKRNNIGFWFGGTLFEIAYSQGKLDGYVDWIQSFGTSYFEISDGSINIPQTTKLSLISKLSKKFTVLSEVGSKDVTKVMSPMHWIEEMRVEISAGASKVIAEGRETGVGGIYRPTGELREGLIQEILESGLSASLIFFETPRRKDQLWFLKNVGYNTNMANIPPSDALNLETLRRGLRGDTIWLEKKDEL